MSHKHKSYCKESNFSSFKVPLGRKFHFPYFCIFVWNMTFLLMLPNFNPLRRLEVFFFFFSFLFEISRPPLLGLVPEVKAQITGSDVIGSTRKILHS